MVFVRMPSVLVPIDKETVADVVNNIFQLLDFPM